MHVNALGHKDEIWKRKVKEHKCEQTPTSLKANGEKNLNGVTWVSQPS